MREVVALDEGDLHAACRGVQRHTDAGDPAADHEDLRVAAGTQPMQFGLAAVALSRLLTVHRDGS